MGKFLSRLGLTTFSVFALLYLLFPILVVVILSFSSAGFLTFPPPGFSLRWYRQVWSDNDWLDALRVTIIVGGITTVLSLLLGVPASIALAKMSPKWRGAVMALVVATLIAPSIIKAISTYLFYVPLRLNNTYFGLAAAHTVSSVPFVIINVVAGLQSYDWNLNRAAVIHGATPIKAVMQITLPITAPSIVVGAVFAFMHSAQELLVSFFVLGSVNRPLSVKLWEGVRVAIDPSIAAATSSIIGMGMLTFLLLLIVRGRVSRTPVAT